MKHTKKIILAALCMILVCLCSCADMGVGEEQDSFKKYFSNVVLLSHSGRSERSISAFNANVSYENSTEIEEVIDYGDYCYIAFEVADGYTLSVDEFAFFVKTDGEEGTLDIEFYVTEELPTKIDSGESNTYYPDSAEGDNSVYVPETDSDSGEIIDRGEGEKGDEEIFTEDKKYHTDSMKVSAEWDSVLLKFDSPQTVKEGEYIVIRIKTNCLAIDDRADERISFTVNYLMFHFVNAEQN